MDALHRRITQDHSQAHAVMALYAHCALPADAYRFYAHRVTTPPAAGRKRAAGKKRAHHVVVSASTGGTGDVYTSSTPLSAAVKAAKRRFSDDIDQVCITVCHQPSGRRSAFNVRRERCHPRRFRTVVRPCSQ